MLLSDIGISNLKSLVEYYCSELKDIFPNESLLKAELANLSSKIEKENSNEKLEDLIILISDSIDKVESITNNIDIKNEQEMKDFMKSVVFSKIVKSNLESAVTCISKIKYLGNNAEVENLNNSTVNNSFAIQLLKNQISNVMRAFDAFIKKNENSSNFKFFENNLSDVFKADDFNKIVSQTKKLLSANDEFLKAANQEISSKMTGGANDFDNLAFFTISTAKVISESSSFIMTTSIVQDILKQIN
ncbi:hypothetical protein [Spiroplasma alleghenense]|uniref:Uncharacterized protein n=1 Tax=Spiroplasma alleghenense TaxID=216931 RepID=A0A345Z456_9MOLU|nr:hypothetical protein [Spiroplasma alleghenense]AXK51385.1 hypothetical protein SALLE_v1c07150 [Spiroplasma alleghenense]